MMTLLAVVVVLAVGYNGGHVEGGGAVVLLVLTMRQQMTMQMPDHLHWLLTMLAPKHLLGKQLQQCVNQAVSSWRKAMFGMTMAKVLLMLFLVVLLSNRMLNLMELLAPLPPSPLQ